MAILEAILAYRNPVAIIIDCFGCNVNKNGYFSDTDGNRWPRWQTSIYTIEMDVCMPPIEIWINMLLLKVISAMKSVNLVK